MNASWLSLVAIGLLAGLPFRLTAQTAPHPFQATDYYKLTSVGEPRPGARQHEEGFVAEPGFAERDQPRAGPQAVRRPGVHLVAVRGGRARARAAARDPARQPPVPRAIGWRRAEAAHERRLEPARSGLVSRRPGDRVRAGLDRHERGEEPGPTAALRAPRGRRSGSSPRSGAPGPDPISGSRPSTTRCSRSS